MMNAPSGKIPETKVRPEDNESRQESRQALGFTDNRPEALVQRQLQRLADQSPQQQRIAQFQAISSSNAHPIQRIRLDNKQIRPYGESGNVLWNEIKVIMIQNGLSPHGAKKIFLQRVKKEPDSSREVFIRNFLDVAKVEAVRAKEQKKLPKKERTRAWTRELKISRPAWTIGHKESAKSGEDIRHVIRNATILKALKAEYDAALTTGPEAALNHFREIARALKLDDSGDTAWELFSRVYKAAYLNFGNLFPGAGAINRVIGLTADDIIGTGLEWLKTGELASEEEIEAIFDHVAYKIGEKSDQTEGQILALLHQGKIQQQGADRFLNGLEEFFDEISDYLIDRQDDFIERAEVVQDESGETYGGVLKAEVGYDLIQIGNNFGFDIPIEPVEPTHMEILLKTEQFLAGYQPGDTGNLIGVLTNFLSLKNILSKGSG